MTRAVKSVPGSLLGIAEDGVIEVLGLEAGALDRGLAGHGAEFHGSKIAQFATVAAHRCARAAYDCNVSWF
jgi:hypothetical protein